MSQECVLGPERFQENYKYFLALGNYQRISIIVFSNRSLKSNNKFVQSLERMGETSWRFSLIFCSVEANCKGRSSISYNSLTKEMHDLEGVQDKNLDCRVLIVRF